MKKAFLTAYEVKCTEPQRLFGEMEKDGIEARGISETGETVGLYIPFLCVKRFELLVERMGYEYTKEHEGLFCRLPRIIKKRAGLVVGAAVCAAAIIISESFVLNIKVMSANDDVRRGVMNVLSEQGVGVGSLIPELEFAELERSLKQRVEGISWAGITVTDSTIVIDVIENIPKPEFRRSRLPSDLVAKHSGTIEKIELYDGLLKLPLGSGVTRGELIVSGRIPVNKTVIKDGKPVSEYSERYVRSLGTAYGTYTETHTFTQPYTEQTVFMNGRRDDRRYLRVFGAELPLFLGGDKGLYRETETYSPLVIFGRELPVGIKALRREGYSIGRVNYSREQARECAMRQIDDYEHNFLADEKIVSRRIDENVGENGVSLTVNYELFGIMSEEKQFFIKKS